MKRLLTLVAFFATLQASAQQVNPVPDYVFRNQMSVGRNAVTDTAAYFSIGPRYGANKGFMPPIVVDTATFSSGKRNGLLIFSVQKNKFLYWDSVRVQWSDMAGSSGSYITGSGITGYLPQFSASTILDTSALFTLGNRLGIGTSTFAYNSTNTANMELNGTAGGILGFKRNDSARGYLWHTGDNMELANTAAGSISFNTNSATRGSISSAGVWRLHNLAGTGDRVVVASSNGTLSAASSATALVDTTTISTRAWRQKGDDSLGAIIATKGSGTVTSVATGYGLSGGTITTTGTLLVDTLNIATRAWRQKGIDSVAGLSRVGGSGTTNYVAKFTAGSTIGNSQIFDNGTRVGIGTASPAAKIDVRGTGTQDVYLISTTATNVENSLQSYFNNGGAWADLSTKSQNLIFNTGPSGGPQAERLRITSGGDVGIGTSSPISSSVLDVTSSTNVYPRIRSTGTGEAFQFYQNSTSGTTAADGLFVGINSGNDAFFYNAEATPARFFTSATERLRIFANGRIGINTTTDAGYQLDVSGTIRATSVIRSDGNFYNESANPAYSARLNTVDGQRINMEVIGTDGRIQVTRNSGTQPNLILATEGGEKMRITAAGNVGINQNSPSYLLDINGTLRSVNGANFATTSGSVGIGTASPASKLDVLDGDISVNTLNTFSFFNTNRNTIPSGAGTSLGGLRYRAYSTGTTYQVGAQILSFSSAAWSSTSSPSYLSFQTTPSGSVTPSERMVIDASGNVGIGTASPTSKLDVVENAIAINQLRVGQDAVHKVMIGAEPNYAEVQAIRVGVDFNKQLILQRQGGEVLIATSTDAGDYKLQVSGNALVTAGKLDITTNTGFGLSVTRSGTSVVAGQINNSNGILYYGAESSTGGGLFTGSSAYAAVIGSGAAYPLQFATDNVTRATINTNGELLINTTTDNGDFKLQVNGNALISGSIKTANGTSSTAVPWHLGSVVATNVQLDTANYVEVEINGTFYRLAIVTPL